MPRGPVSLLLPPQAATRDHTISDVSAKGSQPEAWDIPGLVLADGKKEEKRHREVQFKRVGQGEADFDKTYRPTESL